jgi:menaquinone-9 beta-reductase
VQDKSSFTRFVDECLKTGIPAEFYAHSSIAGPLATFSGFENWVDHPYANRIALIGDAAATSDPNWGQGMSLTLRDARVLTEALLENQDWDAAGHSYATEHDRCYGVIHTVENLLAEFFFERGRDADLRRERALPLIAEDPTRVPDHIANGPDLPLDDKVRRRFFGDG